MKIMAKQTIIYNGTRHKPGSVFEIEDIEGKAMIQQRFAVSAESTEAAAEVAATADGPVQQTISADAEAGETATVQTISADEAAPVQTARKAK